MLPLLNLWGFYQIDSRNSNVTVVARPSRLPDDRQLYTRYHVEDNNHDLEHAEERIDRRDGRLTRHEKPPGMYPVNPIAGAHQHQEREYKQSHIQLW
jgi:hypothetical protein